jgi:AcrR family transcriptional regulator
MVTTAAKRQRHDLASLVEVAVGVFAERGYDGTTIDDIAAAAGVAKSSIYHHVDNKAELLELAVDRAMARLQELEQREVLIGKTAIERLRLVCRAVIRLTIEKNPHLTLIRRLPLMTATAPWALKRYVRYETLVARYVDDAIAEGIVRDDVDPLLVSRFMWFATTGIAEIQRLDPTTALDELTDLALKLMLDGAGKRGPRET